MTNPNEYKVTAFGKPDVWVSAPTDLNVSLDATTTTDAMKVKQANFQLIRVLGNLSFKAISGSGKTPLSSNRKAYLQVSYTPDDVSKASDIGRPLAIAWWNGSQWVPFAPGRTRIEAPNVPTDRPIGLFEIDNFSDPPIGAGA